MLICDSESYHLIGCELRDEVSCFENGLRQLVRILEPLARVCKCLESTKATAGGVFIISGWRYLQNTSKILRITHGWSSAAR